MALFWKSGAVHKGGWTMKRRLFALTLALLLVLSLAACGGSKSAEFTAEAPAADMA